MVSVPRQSQQLDTGELSLPNKGGFDIFLFPVFFFPIAWAANLIAIPEVDLPSLSLARTVQCILSMQPVLSSVLFSLPFRRSWSARALDADAFLLFL